MKDPFALDLTPQPVIRKLREKDIQKKCVEYARSKGFWARKFSSPSQRSVPDYLFGKQMKNGQAVKWAEEFKAPKKGPTDAQRDEQKLMRDAGWVVYPDTGRWGQADIDAFKRRIDALEKL